jgi:hypothetical protein
VHAVVIWSRHKHVSPAHTQATRTAHARKVDQLQQRSLGKVDHRDAHLGTLGEAALGDQQLVVEGSHTTWVRLWSPVVALEGADEGALLAEHLEEAGKEVGDDERAAVRTNVGASLGVPLRVQGVFQTFQHVHAVLLQSPSPSYAFSLRQHSAALLLLLAFSETHGRARVHESVFLPI